MLGISPNCSNGAFREAVAAREARDAQLLADKLKRPLDAAEASHCGVSQLRGYLEHVLQQRYLESVPSILPLLEQEFRTTVCAPSACNFHTENAGNVAFIGYSRISPLHVNAYKQQITFRHIQLLCRIRSYVMWQTSLKTCRGAI